MPPAPTAMSRIRNTVVIAAPTSTTNIPGFFSSVTGFNFPNEAWIARLTISGSNNGRDRTSFLGRREVGSSCGTIGLGLGGAVIVVDIVCISSARLKELAALHQEVLHNGCQRERREIRQGPDDDHCSGEKADEQGTVRRERSTC